jgi:uncharacterized protein
MVVALLSIEMFLPGSQSLKDTRLVLRRVKDRLAKFNVPVAEIGHQDLGQRAGPGLAVVATADQQAEHERTAALNDIERVEPGLVTRTELHFLR